MSWYTGICLVQVAIVVWLLLSQFLYSAVQHTSLLCASGLASSIALLGLLGCVLFSMSPVRREQTRKVVVCLEFALTCCATVFGSVAGYQLLFLLILAKAGFIVQDSKTLALVVTLVALAFAGFACPNQHLFVQSVQGREAPTSVVALILSRELPTFALSAALILLAIKACRAEERQRKELEELSGRLAEITSELERTRVVGTIETAVQDLIATCVLQVDAARKIDGPDARDAIEIARDSASQALLQIRQALKVLRQ